MAEALIMQAVLLVEDPLSLTQGQIDVLIIENHFSSYICVWIDTFYPTNRVQDWHLACFSHILGALLGLVFLFTMYSAVGLPSRGSHLYIPTPRVFTPIFRSVFSLIVPGSVLTIVSGLFTYNAKCGLVIKALVSFSFAFAGFGLHYFSVSLIVPISVYCL